MRHTHATILLKAGVHPKILSEQLGHSAVAITLNKSSHVTISIEEQAVTSLDDLLE